MSAIITEGIVLGPAHGSRTCLPARQLRHERMVAIEPTQRDRRAICPSAVIDQQQAIGDLGRHARTSGSLDLVERDVPVSLFFELVDQANQLALLALVHATRRKTPTSRTTCATAPPSHSKRASKRWRGCSHIPSAQFSAIKNSPNKGSRNRSNFEAI